MVFQVIREPEFAKRVTQCREKLDLRQTDCASMMGVSRQHWSGWETGYCKPKDKRLRKMASVLQCEPVWLRHGDGSDAGRKIENVMTMLRMAVRDLEHAYKALAK